MRNEEARNLTFNDAIPADRDQAEFCVAFAVDPVTSSVRFLTGRFAPENLAGQIVWFPLVADAIHTLVEVYRRQGLFLRQQSWTTGQPYHNNLGKLGYPETEPSTEIMMAFKATATWLKDEQAARGVI